MIGAKYGFHTGGSRVRQEHPINAQPGVHVRMLRLLRFQLAHLVKQCCVRFLGARVGATSPETRQEPKEKPGRAVEGVGAGSAHERREPVDAVPEAMARTSGASKLEAAHERRRWKLQKGLGPNGYRRQLVIIIT